MSFDVGQARIRVVPSFDGIEKSIDKAARSWGISAGTVFGREFNDKVKEQTNNAPLGPSAPTSRKQGSESGGAFADAFRKKIEAAVKALPDVEIGASATEAEQ